MSAGKYVSYVRQSEFSERKLLRDEFCSPWWIAASHDRKRDAQGRIRVYRKREASPVGDMVKCSACGRWAPADQHDPLCIDCRAEADHENFLRRSRRWPIEDRVFVFRTYWRRPMAMRHWLKESMPPPVGVLDFDVTPSDNSGDDNSPVNEADIHDGSPEPDQGWGNVPGFHESLRRMRDRFVEEYVNKKGETNLRLRRRFLYQKVMAPESENALRKEIAYYQKTGKIMPRARRLNNPFDKLEVPLKMPGLPFDPEEGFFD